MKQLLLIRHAKSSWDEPFGNDIDRPLNERGEKDAKEMAKRLVHKKIGIDRFVSSPARRAVDTARYFLKAFDRKPKHLVLEPRLYEPQPVSFYNVIAELDNETDCIALFSHNPGITDFINQLTEVRVDDMPTCGIFGLKTDIKKWADFRDAENHFWFFDYPKLKS